MKVFSRYGVRLNGGTITISDNSEVRIESSISLRIRFKLSTVSEVVVLRKDNEYRLRINNEGKLVFEVYDGSDYEPCVIGPKIDCGQWYDVVASVVVGDTIAKAMYVNSIENKYVEETQSGSVGATTNNLVIGGFDGVVDLFMVYKPALSEDKVVRIFEREFVPYGLRYYLSIEEGDGNNLYDVVKGYEASADSNIEWVMGKELEDLYSSGGKIVLVKKYM